MNILIALTSHGELGGTGYRTGIWLAGFAATYYGLLDAGAELTIASPRGGQPPIDPRGDDPVNASDCVRRFRQDQAARALLADTLRLDQVFAGDFDASFFAGGYGAMWDFAESADCARLVCDFHASDRPLALVCHGVAALLRAEGPDGRPLVAGKSVTGTPDSEVRAVQLADVLPFSLQDELIGRGAQYSKAADGMSHVVRDGILITGQNPNSALQAVRTLLDALRH
jgi:putative intracellular protease/amidase